MKKSILLNNLISKCNSIIRSDIEKFVKERRQSIDLTEKTKKVFLEEANQLNDIVTFMDFKDNISITQKQHTENGKLLKEHVCIVCSNTFNSNRKNAKYCSSKCKQAAYTEKIERMDCNVN